MVPLWVGVGEGGGRQTLGSSPWTTAGHCLTKESGTQECPGTGIIIHDLYDLCYKQTLPGQRNKLLKYLTALLPSLLLSRERIGPRKDNFTGSVRQLFLSTGVGYIGSRHCS